MQQPWFLLSKGGSSSSNFHCCRSAWEIFLTKSIALVFLRGNLPVKSFFISTKPYNPLFECGMAEWVYYMDQKQKERPHFPRNGRIRKKDGIGQVINSPSMTNDDNYQTRHRTSWKIWPCPVRRERARTSASSSCRQKSNMILTLIFRWSDGRWPSWRDW